MGIIFKQSFKNSLIIYMSFFIGGINTLVFYPRILQDDYYGLVVFLLSASNLIMPLAALGVQYTIVKFFSSYKDEQEADRFLTVVLFFPLLIAIPLGYFWDFFHDWIINIVPEENRIVKDYTISIYIIALSCAYFEVFYSWAKVQLQSVFGNVLKEFWNRAVVMLLLIAVFMNWLTRPEFIYFLTGAYIIRTLVMMFYAFYLYLPKFQFKLPHNFSEVFKYSIYILLGASAGAIILDIDKVMIPDKDAFEVAAYYTVAVFIGSFIEAPSRAMRQILQPITSQTLNARDEKEVANLYKKSSINLLLIGGLFFLLVNCGVTELFKLLPDKGYAGGELVVLLISLSKLYNMFLGNNGDIINNSKFYRVTMLFGGLMALCIYYSNVFFYHKLELGTDGLAIATFLTIFVFNSLKIFFVQAKFFMNPFTDKTWLLMGIILILFGTFYFWDFNLHPIINILIKSAIISVIYLLIVIKLNISSEINKLVSKFVKI